MFNYLSIYRSVRVILLSTILSLTVLYSFEPIGYRGLGYRYLFGFKNSGHSFKIFPRDNNYSKDSTIFVEFVSSTMLYNNIPDLRLSAMLIETIKDFSILIEPVIVNEYYGEAILGSEYERSNISGRIENAIILFNKDYLTLEFGRSSVWWGQSSKSSIIQSGLYPSYDHLITRLHLSNFYFELLGGQLGSENTLDGRRIKRNIAGHSLFWNPNKNTIIGIGEQIIYTGVSRGFELTYLNPFVPYFFTGLEGDEETQPYDNDNSILFTFGRYNLNEKFSIYFEMIIDDLQVDNTHHDHSLGYKIGLEGELDRRAKNIWLLEYTKIDPWTYIHHGQYTSWQNRGHSIGFPYGPDNICIQAQWLSNFGDKFYLSYDFVYLKKGNNNLETDWNNSLVTNSNSLNIEYFFYNISVIRNYNWGVIEGGWSFKPFPSTIATDSKLFPETGSLFIKLVLILNKEFKFK